MDQLLQLEDSIHNFIRENKFFINEIFKISQSHGYVTVLEYIRNDEFGLIKEIDNLWLTHVKEMTDLRHILAEYVHKNTDFTYHTFWSSILKENKLT